MFAHVGWHRVFLMWMFTLQRGTEEIEEYANEVDVCKTEDKAKESTEDE
jgi:hypothetical protein